MDSGTLAALVEGTVVVIEIFTINLYLSGVFHKNNRPLWCEIVSYLLFGLILGAASIFYPHMVLLPLITFAGILGLAFFLYEGQILSFIFSSLLYLIIAVVIESIVPGLQSLVFDLQLTDIHSFGFDRILTIVTTKLFILIVVKIINIVIAKHQGSLHRRMLQSIPLIVCQLILIFIVTSLFIDSYQAYSTITVKGLLEIAGVFFVSIVILWYYNLLVSTYELRHRNEIATMQLENQIKYYSMIKTHQDTINAIEHDLKRHVAVIGNMEKMGHGGEVTEYISNYASTMKINMSLVFTPHPVVSSILSDCLQRANKAHVENHFDISVPSVLDINQIDLTVILGNTIDNAFEALEEVTNDMRYLSLTLKQSEHYLFYEIINTFCTVNKKNQGNSSRGYGLNNVRSCIEKYGGDFNTKTDENKFIVTTLIPCNSESIQSTKLT